MLQKAFHDMNPSLTKGIQHDAHECLVKLLDFLVDPVIIHLSPYCTKLMLCDVVACLFSQPTFCFLSDSSINPATCAGDQFKKMHRLFQSMLKLNFPSSSLHIDLFSDYYCNLVFSFIRQRMKCKLGFIL